MSEVFANGMNVNISIQPENANDNAPIQITVLPPAEGPKGEPGFSPKASVKKTDAGAVITVEDEKGVTSTTIENGKDGKDGAPGKDGPPGPKGDTGDDNVFVVKLTFDEDYNFVVDKTQAEVKQAVEDGKAVIMLDVEVGTTLLYMGEGTIDGERCPFFVSPLSEIGMTSLLTNIVYLKKSGEVVYMSGAPINQLTIKTAYGTETFDGSVPKTIDLTNLGSGGSGGITQETDPNVPAWAKQPNKPRYTADEVGAASKESVDMLSEEIANKQPAGNYAKTVEGFPADSDGNIRIEYPVKTEKGYRHDELPEGGKTITVYSNDVYTNAPHIFMGENFWPQTPYLAGKYVQHGLSYNSDGNNITVKGTAIAGAAFRLAREDGGDMNWPIPDGISAGDKVSLYVFAALSETRSLAVYVRFLNEAGSELSNVVARVQAGNLIATSLNKTVPDGAVKMKFECAYTAGETHDITFFPVLVKASTEIINDLSFVDGKIEVSTQNTTNSICSAPFVSEVDYDAGLKTYIDYKAADYLKGDSDSNTQTYVFPEMFGAYGDDDHDDTSALQACIDCAIQTGRTVIGGGAYKTSSPIVIACDNGNFDIRQVRYSGDDCALIIYGMNNSVSIGWLYAPSAVGVRLGGGMNVQQTSYNKLNLRRVIAGKNGIELLSSACSVVSNNTTFECIRSGSEYACIYHSPYPHQIETGTDHGNNNFTGGLLEGGKWGVYNARHQDTYLTCRFEGVDNAVHHGNGGTVRIISPRYVELILFSGEEGKGLVYQAPTYPDDTIPFGKRYPEAINFTLESGGGAIKVENIDVHTAPTKKVYSEDGVAKPLSKLRASSPFINQKLSAYGLIVARNFIIFANHILITEPIEDKTKRVTMADVGYIGDYHITRDARSEFIIYSTFIIDEGGCEYTLPPSYDCIAFRRFKVIQQEGTSCTFKDWRGTPVFNGSEYGAGVYEVCIKNGSNEGDNYENTHQIWEIRRISDYSLVDVMPHAAE